MNKIIYICVSIYNMSFKKLSDEFKENLLRFNISEPTAFQKKVMPVINSGTNVFGFGEAGAGKTSALIISVIRRLKTQSKYDPPRAIVIVENKEKAIELEEMFRAYMKHTDLLIFSAFEEQKIENQKDAFYEGVDIAIVTMKRFGRLYFLNGINLNEVQMIIIDDASFVLKNGLFSELVRLSESINKCQYIVLSSENDKRFVRLEESFMKNARKIDLT